MSRKSKISSPASFYQICARTSLNSKFYNRLRLNHTYMQTESYISCPGFCYPHSDLTFGLGKLGLTLTYRRHQAQSRRQLSHSDLINDGFEHQYSALNRIHSFVIWGASFCCLTIANVLILKLNAEMGNYMLLCFISTIYSHQPMRREEIS